MLIFTEFELELSKLKYVYTYQVSYRWNKVARFRVQLNNRHL